MFYTGSGLTVSPSLQFIFEQIIRADHGKAVEWAGATEFDVVQEQQQEQEEEHDEEEQEHKEEQQERSQDRPDLRFSFSAAIM